MRLAFPAIAALSAALGVGLAGLPLPASARTLVFCSEGNPESLDPAAVTTTTAMNVTWQMFNTLVEFSPGTTVIRPGLAESWRVSEDGRTYDFSLRTGVRFHANARFTPSRTLEAQDVLFSFLRQWKPDHPFHRARSGFTYFRDLGLADLLEGVEALDARTIRFRLKEPDATFLPNLAQAFAAIHSAEYADILAAAGAHDELERAPIGTGPFSFAGYRPDIAVRYRGFAAYWRAPEALEPGLEPIDGLVFSITPNPAVRLAKLKAGECQVMAFPAPTDLPTIEADPNLTLISKAELNVAYLALNTRKAPFDDVRVRRAINLAIDRRAIVEAAYGAAGLVARGPLPPGLWASDTGLPDIPFDRAEALQLLKEAGHGHGFETDLWYPPVSRPYNPDGRRVADMIQADLARIGVRARLVTEPWSAYRAALYGGVPQAMLYGWTGDNGDPDNFLNVLLGCKAAEPGGANLARWCDAEYDSAIQAARRTSDVAARTALYRHAQGIFRREAPWVPLAHTVVHMALRRSVVGFRMDPLGRHLFEGVALRDEAPETSR
ncbi:ABC transporter substrate-binding protein [Methylobacterium durans]|uniref:ABC transporter substrate-binding protein n=1 Tax=Methylobacterium durans TaxID=2202825 RepID=UPI002AFE4056|nr:ABC transporter substrate-binding protein [Methylobacterium durans]MEA1834488.1 ABC transporter substrate-binding protein [Methylobacterium durans]